jgi:hypothetical protein
MQPLAELAASLANSACYAIAGTLPFLFSSTFSNLPLSFCVCLSVWLSKNLPVPLEIKTWVLILETRGRKSNARKGGPLPGESSEPKRIRQRKAQQNRKQETPKVDITTYKSKGWPPPINRLASATANSSSPASARRLASNWPLIGITANSTMLCYRWYKRGWLAVRLRSQTTLTAMGLSG